MTVIHGNYVYSDTYIFTRERGLENGSHKNVERNSAHKDRRQLGQSRPPEELNPQAVAGVIDALKQILPHHNFDQWQSPSRLKITNYESSTAWFTMRDVTSSTAVKTTDVARMGDEATTFATEYADADTAAPPQRIGRNPPTLTTTTTPTTTTTILTTRTKRSKRRRTTTTLAPKLDIASLLKVIANLTADYSLNLAMMLNKSLERYSIPTCPTPTHLITTEETIATTDAFANLTGTIMGKCFVCGLDDIEIPRHSHCADAFAGDFIPLVQVDATARGHIARYRKYCRWMNVEGYFINASDPRSMWGRWTGGCSVRWIDLNGYYTQRTCRNRHHAVMGRHFISKRMAKLEMALQHIDSGCIISPVASLVPLSRGVSLYARFHACVCVGNWCNQAPPSHLYSSHLALITFLIRIVFIS
ncbi:uncharacterized protein LOC126373416 [Pectinophora gossypiella]|uniref:uncharacterized protein LOC126373416 n=1 Tax=Pectinophora gossypiella TaxID=13191 RepID=UPI00214EC6CC|nr:uncharacterized protein LOC126373416 [Pectinophora gossypiella]